jgi:hypothetical protein
MTNRRERLLFWPQIWGLSDGEKWRGYDWTASAELGKESTLGRSGHADMILNWIGKVDGDCSGIHAPATINGIRNFLIPWRSIPGDAQG